MTTSEIMASSGRGRNGAFLRPTILCRLRLCLVSALSSTLHYSWSHGQVDRTQARKALRFYEACSFGLCHKGPPGRVHKKKSWGKDLRGDLRLCLPCFRSDTGRRRRRPCSPVGPLRAKGLRFRLGRCKSEDSGGNGVNLFQHRIESTHRLPHIELGLKTEPKSC